MSKQHVFREYVVTMSDRTPLGCVAANCDESAETAWMERSTLSEDNEEWSFGLCLKCVEKLMNGTVVFD